MRYFKLTIPALLILVLCLGCAKKQVVQPVEEIPVEEEIPFEEVEIPEEIPEEPPKPEFVLGTVFFDFDKSDIRVDAAEVLQGNSEMLKLYPEIRTVVQGHCCEIGTAEYNLALGERRAKATRDYLLILGITPDRLSTVSYGEERPLDRTNLERNRRCEFVVE
jgi:peptidoglycan-associated lipoprotein